MKTIYRIAKAELYSLFFSPVAWLVLIIFTFQAGINFTDLLKWHVRDQEAGYPVSNLTIMVFLHPMFGFFKTMVDNLFYYIPLLTMGLMSREISSGSIKLLLSAPVSIREIVLGKFMAMMVYCLFLITVLLLVMLTGDLSIAHLDNKVLFSGLLGIYLLVCAYSAIGLFMSSLTSYQVVAAISTLAMLAALNYVRQVGQAYDLVRKITYFISLAGRTNQFISGLISSKDILYFVIAITFFLGLTVMKLSDGRALRSAWVKTGRYLAMTLLTFLAGYVSSRPALTAYYDMTVNKRRTLTPNSQQVVGQLKQPVQINTYINLLDPRFYFQRPEARNEDIDYWEPFVRFLPDMKFNYVYYYDTSADKYLFKRNAELTLDGVAKKVAASWELNMDLFLTPAQVRRQIDLESEEHRVIRQAEMNGKKSFLRMYDEIDPNPSEQEISSAFKRFLVTPPKIAFLTSQYERDMDMVDDHGYKYAMTGIGTRHALINQGFDVLPISSLVDQDIPKDATAVVIADPRKAFLPAELDKIRNYLAEGGNMLIAGEPNKQQLLNPVLQQLGIQMMEGVLIQQSKDYSPDYIQAYFSPSAAKLAGRFTQLWKDSTKVIMPGTVGLSYTATDSFHITPLVVTNAVNTWNKVGSFAMDTGKVTFNPEHGDLKRSFPLALAVTRNVGKREQRIIVLGDADYMSNRLYPNQLMYPGNYALGEESYRWLCDGQFPVDVDRPETPDKRMKISHEDLGLIRILFLGVLPAILLIAGIILLIRRKRK